MTNTARNHRDNVFCMLYRDRGNLLSGQRGGFLCPYYNAVNGTDYRDEGEPELELKVRQININRGCSEGILGKCESLKGYMALDNKL